ncbi:MAG: hypothetical protein IPJ65_14400 [Archangiaceae bacterium]|nr:hypothetical protein [Archangiaceae bacterium]
MRAGLLALLCACGCGYDPGATVPLAAPDRMLFELESAPLLEQRCGDSSCHGSARHAYALYAVGRRRLETAATWSRAPLTAAELDLNWLATLGFLDAPEPVRTTLLAKALGRSHGGGAVFAHPSDPECQAVLRWLEGSPP